MKQKSSFRKALTGGKKPPAKPNTAVKAIRSASNVAKKGGLKSLKIKLKFNEPKKAK